MSLITDDRLQRTAWAITVALPLALSACSNASTADLDGGALITLGAEYVQQRNCAMCHQSPNAADGTLSGQAMARPGTMAYGSNLTPDHATGIGDWADIEIVRSMRFGLDNDDQALCPPMPHYDGADGGTSLSYMTDLEASAIVAYLRSLPPVTRLDGGIPTSVCPPIEPPPMWDLAPPPSTDMAAAVAPVDGGTRG